VGKKQGFNIVEHGADIGVEVFSNSINGLYQIAVEAFTSIITNTKKINPIQSRIITIEGNDKEQYLVNLLSELIFIYDVDQFLCKKAIVKNITSSCLRVDLYGETFDDRKHDILADIKAVTYHGLSIIKKDDLFKTTIIFDL
jgi:SHS2 domain-containing protein